MEFSYTESNRSNEVSSPWCSFLRNLKENVGLLIFPGTPSEEARIIFSTKNLTTKMIQANMILLREDDIGASKGEESVVNMILLDDVEDDGASEEGEKSTVNMILSNDEGVDAYKDEAAMFLTILLDDYEFDASKGKESIVDACPTPAIPSCIFMSSSHVPMSLICDHRLNTTRFGNSSLRSNPVDIIPLDSLLPLTTCVRHGNAGFFPLPYAKTFEKYTRTIDYTYPIPKVVHHFENCLLKFPLTDQIEDDEIEDGHFLKRCSRCKNDLQDEDDIYMYRDNMYCSESCRYKVASLTPDSDSDDDIDNSACSDAVSSSSGGETIFSIECDS